MDPLLTNGAATFLDRWNLPLFVRCIVRCSLLQVLLIISRSHIVQLIDWVEIGSVVVSIQVPHLIVRLVLFHLQVEDIAHN